MARIEGVAGALEPSKSTASDEKPETVTPPPAEPGTTESWLAGRWAGWSAAVIVGLGAVIWFQTITDRQEKAIAGLRTELDAARQAVDEYPNAVAALQAIKVEQATVAAALEKAKAQEASLDARQKDRAAELSALEKPFPEQEAALEESHADGV